MSHNSLPPSMGACRELQSIALAFERQVTYCVAWLTKAINFQGYGASRDERGGLT